MMRVPVTGKKPPVLQGKPYRLKVKGTETTLDVTVVDVRREPIAKLGLADARREGFGTVQGARDAFTARHGMVAEVWVILFVKGDESPFFDDRSWFLQPTGGYTTAGDTLEAGQVIDPALAKRFAKEAQERRREAHRESLMQKAAEARTLRASLKDMKQRQLVRQAARALEAAARIQSEDDVRFNTEPLELGAEADGPTSDDGPAPPLRLQPPCPA